MSDPRSFTHHPDAPLYACSGTIAHLPNCGGTCGELEDILPQDAPYGMRRVLARAREIDAEFWEYAGEAGIDSAVWRLARALALYEVENAE